MALAFTNLDAGTVTSFPATSASVTVPNNGAVYVSIAVAQVSNPSLPTVSTPTGLSGVTWTSIGGADYRARRRLQVYRALNTSGSDITGTVSMDFTAGGGATKQELMWSIDRVTGIDTATPNDAAVTGANEATSSTLTLADVGTPGTGDVVFCAFGAEESGTTMSLEASYTNLGTQQSGGNVRQLRTGYDAADPQDETPSCTWSSSGTGAGGVGFIVNAGAGGGAATSFPPIRSRGSLMSALLQR